MSLLNEEDLQQMEFLLNHCKNGTHVLFENQELEDILKKVVNDADYFNPDRMDHVQTLLSELIGKRSLLEKKDFLKSLPEDEYELIVRAYFHIIENNVFTATPLLH